MFPVWTVDFRRNDLFLFVFSRLVYLSMHFHRNMNLRGCSNCCVSSVGWPCATSSSKMGVKNLPRTCSRLLSFDPPSEFVLLYFILEKINFSAGKKNIEFHCVYFHQREQPQFYCFTFFVSATLFSSRNLSQKMVYRFSFCWQCQRTLTNNLCTLGAK